MALSFNTNTQTNRNAYKLHLLFISVQLLLLSLLMPPLLFLCPIHSLNLYFIFQLKSGGVGAVVCVG
jgi:hypothetical protein